MSLQVLDPGLRTLRVDGGRLRSRALGVPVGGAADRTAWALGNALVGNRPEAAALEVALYGPTLRATADHVAVLFGAPFHLRLDGRTIPSGTVFELRTDQILQILGTPRGVCAYLCVSGGGFRAPTVLGSRSSLRPIEANEVLSCGYRPIPPRSLGFVEVAEEVGFDRRLDRLRIVAGPQADWFALESFAQQTFTVTMASDRMGIRLSGPPLPLPRRELVSEPVAPGAIQVTNDGQCIILGIDGQTIGGYPKIGHVIRADLDILAQLRPGTKLRFDWVQLEQAEQLAQLQARTLHEWLTRLDVQTPLLPPRDEA